jgi:proteasome lid subunit RPN8/RPN11
MSFAYLTEQAQEAIKAHALREPSREVCGLVLNVDSKVTTLECSNVSLQPEKSFIINPSAILPYLKSGALVAYYHSHPKGDEKLSDGDKRISELAGYPVCCFSLTTGKFAEYTPCGFRPPLLGRQWISGVQDCFALFQDYYREKLGIYVDRPDITLEVLANGAPMLFEWMRTQDFVRVQGKPKEHDVLCMSILCKSGQCNHVAIYTGNNVMMHHLINELSAIRVYGGAWERNTVAIARHKSLIK